MTDSKRLVDNQELLGGMYDRTEAERQKRLGLARAESTRTDLLTEARAIAIRIAESRASRTCVADDVQQAMLLRGHSPKALGPAAGGIFRGRRWERTGEWRPSSRVSNHGHCYPVWRLK